MDENIKRFFSDEITLESLDRNALIQALIKRHTLQIEPLRAEVKNLKERMGVLETDVKRSREKRDAVNREVMDLKQTRRALHELANEKRREFFLLIEKQVRTTRSKVTASFTSKAGASRTSSLRQAESTFGTGLNAPFGIMNLMLGEVWSASIMESTP